MISKEKLQANVNAVKSETKEALELIYNTLNNGQQKKSSKIPKSRLC